MPKQVLPEAEDFAAFRRSLLKRGFLEIQGSSKGEAGFSFEAHGLIVVVWTTFLPEEIQARAKDAGWVLIRQGEQVKYFGHPLSRTKNYFNRLLWYACIARVRVLERPQCPVCNSFMEIAQRRGVLKARFWKCSKSHKAEYRSWDQKLPQAARAFLRKERKQRKRYYDKLKRENKKYGRAMLLRKRVRSARTT